MSEQKNILFKPLSNRRARDVARVLKTKGYLVTITECYGRSPIEIIDHYLPKGDESARYKMAIIISMAARLTTNQLMLSSDTVLWMLNLAGKSVAEEGIGRWTLENRRYRRYR